MITAVLRSLSLVAIVAGGKWNRDGDLGLAVAITATTPTAATDMMPQLMIRARRGPCDIRPLDPGRAGGARFVAVEVIVELLPAGGVYGSCSQVLRKGPFSLGLIG